MTIYYSAELAGIASTPVVKPQAMLGHAAQVRRYRGTITLASQLTTDSLVFCNQAAGSLLCFGILTASVSLGTSTLAIGDTASAAKYRAAATFVAVDTPTFFGPAIQVGSQLPGIIDDQITGTIAVATLPAAGTLVCDIYASDA